MGRSTTALLAMLALIAGACSAQPETTSGPTSPPPSPTSTSTTLVDAGSLGIEGLDFAEFLETSFALLAVRDPQGLTSAGVASEHRLRNDKLNDLSDAFLRETQQLEVAILEELRRFERNELAPADRISYDSYEWYLDHQVRGHRFMYHDWPVHHFVNSYNFNLLLFLTDEHPVESLDDAQDYVARLWQIAAQVGQVIDGLQRRVAAGIVPVAEIADLTVNRLDQDARGDARSLALYTSFEDRLGSLAGLTGEQTAELLEEAAEAIEQSFLPAWAALADYMRSIRHLASDQAGVGRHPDGEDYYAHLLRGHTSTALDAGEVHELGLVNVERVQAELREVFDQLGYPQDATLVDLMARAAAESGVTSGAAAISLNEALIGEAAVVFRPLFGLWPDTPVVVVPDPGGGGYYVPGTVDGSRPGAFYAGTGMRSLMSIPTINYHEAVPGHHTQIAIARTLDLPSFQRFVMYNGFVEGWALYAERLAAEVGLYDDDPYGNVGRLELELLRAVRLVVDTGIHALGWSADEARAYMLSLIPTWAHEVQRYMVLPGQATGYMIGMQEILRLREIVRDREGESFDIAAFHTLVLGSGNQPLVILDRLVSDYVAGGS